MPTSKQIASIGSTTINVVKNGAGNSDEIDYNVYDGASPNTVMQLNGDSSISNSNVTSGSVSVNNLTVNGSLTSVSTSTKQLLFTDRTTTDSTAKASIYALNDPNNGTNHQLILDPYKEDDPSVASTNSGTVYIRGALVVEGDKTILDTATTITSENAIRVNTTGDGTTAGIATSGGLEFLYDNGGITETKTLYYDNSGLHWTTGNIDFKSTGQIYGGTLTDGTATLSGGTLTGNVTSSGTSTFSTVDINGGNIDGTKIGVTTADSGRFTTISSTSSITSYGAITASSAVTGGSLTDGTATLSGGILTGDVNGNVTSLGTSTFSTVDINGGNIDGTKIGVTTADSGRFTTISSTSSITASGAVTGGSLTDGTATLSAGALSGVTTITASSAVTGGSLTDGTATLSAGALSGVTTITASSAVTGGSLTDGTATLQSGSLTGAAAIAASGVISTTNTANADSTGSTGSIVTSGGLYIKSSKSMETGVSTEAALICNGGAYFGENILTGKDIEASGIKSGKFYISRRDGATDPDYNKIIHNYNSVDYTIYRTDSTNGPTIGASNIDIEGDTLTINGGATINDGATFAGTGYINFTSGDVTITGGNLTMGGLHIITATGGGTFGKIVSSASGTEIKNHLHLSEGTTGVLGDVVLVSTSGGSRSANPKVLAGNTATAAPLGVDIAYYFSSKNLDFGTGQFTVSLVEDVQTGGETASAIGTFLYASGNVQLVHGLEAHSTTLDVDVENSTQTVTLTNTSGNDAYYHVRILTIADTGSAQGGY